MNETELLKNLPMWFIMVFLILRYIISAVQNKDFLAFLRERKKPNEEMQAQVKMLTETLLGLQSIILNLETFLKQGIDAQVKSLNEVLNDTYINKFELELYVEIVKYMNKLKWDFSDIIGIYDNLRDITEKVYRDNKNYINQYKLFIPRFNMFSIDTTVNKIVDVLKTNGGTSIEMKKKFIYEILVG